MREAPALAGATRPRPRSAAAPKSKGFQRQGAPSSSLLGRAFARPGVTAAGAVFAALMTGIVANAMFFQKGHHPAPLFKPSPPAPVVDPPQPPVRVEAPVLPVQPPPPVATPAEAPAPVPAPSAPAAKPAPVPKAAAATHAHKAVGRAHQDSIGDLIGTLGHDAPKPAKKTNGSTASPTTPHATDGKARAHLAKDTAATQN